MGCGSSVVTPLNDPTYNKEFRASTAKPMHNKPRHKTLEDILQHEDNKKKFIDFLEHDRSLENLQFLMDVQRYREALDQTEQIAHQIFSKYIEEGSESEVNINRDMRESIRTGISLLGLTPKQVFKPAAIEIQYSIETDSLPRFHLSQQRKAD